MLLISKDGEEGVNVYIVLRALASYYNIVIDLSLAQE